jgi:hypothetical protein
MSNLKLLSAGGGGTTARRYFRDCTPRFAFHIGLYDAIALLENEMVYLFWKHGRLTSSNLLTCEVLRQLKVAVIFNYMSFM